jgi:hypothetical protein
MRTIGVKNSHMLRNVIGNKMNRVINTIGNRRSDNPINNKYEFLQPSPDIFTANAKMNNLLQMPVGLKKLHIGSKSLYEKRKK